MTKHNDGGPAFPHRHDYGNGSWETFHGLTKRDYIAIKAMAVIISQPNLEGHDPTIVARWAYEYADVMLVARDA